MAKYRSLRGWAKAHEGIRVFVEYFHKDKDGNWLDRKAVIASIQKMADEAKEKTGNDFGEVYEDGAYWRTTKKGKMGFLPGKSYTGVIHNMSNQYYVTRDEDGENVYSDFSDVTAEFTTNGIIKDYTSHIVKYTIM